MATTAPAPREALCRPFCKAVESHNTGLARLLLAEPHNSHPFSLRVGQESRIEDQKG